ncbi:MAG: hypothetical protein Q8909_18685, partial [Bacteroidota bacterium]|nr:hypothetical protein [Bacteroidota bacterium]
MENNENASEKLNMREKLKEGLMPLYAELPVDFPGKPQNMFCVQWGKLYPKNEKKILFVGKAVNDWCDRLPVDIAFSHNEERIFDREDQMIWVTEPDGNGYFYAN